MVVIVSIIIGDNVIPGEVDRVGASDLEENALIFSDSDIEGLLVMLGTC